MNSTPEQQDTSRRGTHPVEIAPLVIALAIAGVLALWAAVTLETLSPPTALVLSPLPWLAAGGIGLILYGVRAARDPGRP